MKKDIFFVVIQFILFAIYFGIDWHFVDIGFPVWVDYVSILFLIIGVFIILLGILNLNENLSPFPSPKRNANLISSGIYKYIRHPIYTGILIAMTSYAVFVACPFKLTITLVLAIVFYFKSNLEEELLIERFEQYKDYIKSTGRFFPRISHKQS
ncbi:MAG: isoprenylcysteine carboxylmethyltransferase family protein [Bacteroidota bacterium]